MGLHLNTLSELSDGRKVAQKWASLEPECGSDSISKLSLEALTVTSPF